MGCVNSRTDINDLHSNIFQVMNVDDLGNLITPGRLEITDSDIVLYQRGKQPVKWPLRCLRRYGYDSEIFSFESGRRCSTGPGIYAFKCRRADQLFNLVQSNIQVCNSSVDDTVSRDLSITAHTAPTMPRAAIAPTEANYLDPMPVRSNSRATSRFSHSQQNGLGRLSSAGSSSGPMSPQGTMGSPSPPPILSVAAPLCLPPPPPSQAAPPMSAHHPSAVYVNEQVLNAIAMEMELDNNNKSLRRTMQRSHTMSSTSSSGLLSEPQPGMLTLNQESMIKPNSRSPPLVSVAATYINVDINAETTPMSPAHMTCTTTTSGLITTSRDEIKDGLDRARHAYMNVSPGQETAAAESTPRRIRPTALPQPLSQQQQHQQQQQAGGSVGEWEETPRHCYANLEPAEIEGLKSVRFSGSATPGNLEKSPIPPPVPAPPPTSTPPPTEPIREVNYAVLDLDKKNITAVPSSNQTELASANSVPSPPDSPNKQQKGYATIDFNKTAALSHSVNPNVVNDNEGSRKTRHNSTINDLTAPSRHSSSISE